MQAKIIQHENWNQDPERTPFNIYSNHGPRTFRLYAVPNHWHRFYEWLFVIDGDGTIRIGQHEEHHLHPGDLLFIHPNTAHSIVSKSGVLVGYLQFHPEILRSIEANVNRTPSLIGHRILPSFIGADDQHASEIRDLLQSAYDEYGRYTSGDELGHFGYVSAVLQAYVKVSRNYGSSETSSGDLSDSDWLYQLQDFVSHNYSYDIGLKEASKELNMSISHLCRLMQRSIGQTFYQFLREYRMYKAQHLLTSTPLPVTQVAVECGYSNCSAFSRVFHQVVGTSPAQYRKSFK